MNKYYRKNEREMEWARGAMAPVVPRRLSPFKCVAAEFPFLTPTDNVRATPPFQVCLSNHFPASLVS